MLAKGTATQYLGKVIDVGVFGESSTERGSFYILNSKDNFGQLQMVGVLEQQVILIQMLHHQH